MDNWIGLVDGVASRHHSGARLSGRAPIAAYWWWV